MSRKTREVEVIARGVLVSRGRVLLCHSKGAGNTYLPGGHVEFGESARAALGRELKEETGLDVRVGEFLGCVEHSFLQKGKRRCEINLVFKMTARGLGRRAIASNEDWLDFRWASAGELASLNLQPAPLRRMIKGPTPAGGLGPFWASTLSLRRV